MDAWGVSSEVGRLRTVLVHRPGQEHRWTLRWNMGTLLFDDILDVEEAREEHTGFTAQLASKEVEILYAMDLLRDIWATQDAADIALEIIDGELEKKEINTLIDSTDLRPEHLICGYPDTFPSSRAKSESTQNSRILVNPVPNLYFTRDPAFPVPGAVVISSPALKPRRREARLIRSLFQRHKELKSLRVYDGILNAWKEDVPENERPTIEGGDVLVADERTVLIGIGERTNEKGADLLTKYLFSLPTVERVLKIRIPAYREFMHLDTVMTFIDRKRILTLPYLWEEPDRYDYILEKIREQRRTLGEGEDANKEEPIDFQSSLEVVIRGTGGKPEKGESYGNVMEGLNKEGVIDLSATVYVAGRKDKFPSPEEHIIAALREQWNDAANVLALKPGQVICYRRNDRTQRALEEADIEVVHFRGGELVRGRGGSRCMTMPLLRESI